MIRKICSLVLCLSLLNSASAADVCAVWQHGASLARHDYASVDINTQALTGRPMMQRLGPGLIRMVALYHRLGIFAALMTSSLPVLAGPVQQKIHIASFQWNVYFYAWVQHFPLIWLLITIGLSFYDLYRQKRAHPEKIPNIGLAPGVGAIVGGLMSPFMALFADGPQHLAHSWQRIGIGWTLPLLVLGFMCGALLALIIEIFVYQSARFLESKNKLSAFLRRSGGVWIAGTLLTILPHVSHISPSESIVPLMENQKTTNTLSLVINKQKNFESTIHQLPLPMEFNSLRKELKASVIDFNHLLQNCEFRMENSSLPEERHFKIVNLNPGYLFTIYQPSLEAWKSNRKTALLLLAAWDNHPFSTEHRARCQQLCSALKPFFYKDAYAKAVASLKSKGIQSPSQELLDLEIVSSNGWDYRLMIDHPEILKLFQETLRHETEEAIQLLYIHMAIEALSGVHEPLPYWGVEKEVYEKLKKAYRPNQLTPAFHTIALDNIIFGFPIEEERSLLAKRLSPLDESHIPSELKAAERHLLLLLRPYFSKTARSTVLAKFKNQKILKPTAMDIDNKIIVDGLWDPKAVLDNPALRHLMGKVLQSRTEENIRALYYDMIIQEASGYKINPDYLRQQLIVALNSQHLTDAFRESAIKTLFTFPVVRPWTRYALRYRHPAIPRAEDFTRYEAWINSAQPNYTKEFDHWLLIDSGLFHISTVPVKKADQLPTAVPATAEKKTVASEPALTLLSQADAPWNALNTSPSVADKPITTFASPFLYGYGLEWFIFAFDLSGKNIGQVKPVVCLRGMNGELLGYFYNVDLRSLRTDYKFEVRDPYNRIMFEGSMHISNDLKTLVEGVPAQYASEINNADKDFSRAPIFRVLRARNGVAQKVEPIGMIVKPTGSNHLFLVDGSGHTLGRLEETQAIAPQHGTVQFLNPSGSQNAQLWPSNQSNISKPELDKKLQAFQPAPEDEAGRFTRFLIALRLRQEEILKQKSSPWIGAASNTSAAAHCLDLLKELKSWPVFPTYETLKSSGLTSRLWEMLAYSDPWYQPLWETVRKLGMENDADLLKKLIKMGDLSEELTEKLTVNTLRTPEQIASHITALTQKNTLQGKWPPYLQLHDIFAHQNRNILLLYHAIALERAGFSTYLVTYVSHPIFFSFEDDYSNHPHAILYRAGTDWYIFGEQKDLSSWGEPVIGSPGLYKIHPTKMSPMAAHLDCFFIPMSRVSLASSQLAPAIQQYREHTADIFGNSSDIYVRLGSEKDFLWSPSQVNLALNNGLRNELAAAWDDHDWITYYKKFNPFKTHVEKMTPEQLHAFQRAIGQALCLASPQLIRGTEIMHLLNGDVIRIITDAEGFTADGKVRYETHLSHASEAGSKNGKGDIRLSMPDINSVIHEWLHRWALTGPLRELFYQIDFRREKGQWVARERPKDLAAQQVMTQHFLGQYGMTNPNETLSVIGAAYGDPKMATTFRQNAEVRMNQHADFILALEYLFCKYLPYMDDQGFVRDLWPTNQSAELSAKTVLELMDYYLKQPLTKISATKKREITEQRSLLQTILIESKKMRKNLIHSHLKSLRQAA